MMALPKALYTPVYVLQAFRLLFSTKSMMFSFVLPLTLSLVVFLSSLALGFQYFDDLIALRWESFANAQHWFWATLFFLFRVGCALLSASLLSFLVFSLLSGYLTESVIEAEIERYRLSKNDVEVSFLKSSLRALVDDLRRLLLLGLLLGAMGLFSLFPPFLIPLGGLGIFLAGFELMEPSLTLAGYSFRERLGFAVHNAATTFVFGLLFLGVGLIPFAGLLLLPVLSLSPVYFLRASEEALSTSSRVS